MTGSGPAVVGQAFVASMAETEELDTRFGRIAVSPRQAIAFPNGMLGIPDKTNYCLTHFPSVKMARFKMLQSLDDTALSFITLPVDITNPIIERTDLEQAANDLNIPLNDLAVLLVVTVHRDSGAAKLSTNARAPILVHVSRRTAVQHVFPNTKYLIRQPLTV